MNIRIDDNARNFIDKNNIDTITIEAYGAKLC